MGARGALASVEPPVQTLSGADKAAVRSVVFHHLAGIALAPTVNALRNRAVFELLQDAPNGRTLTDLVTRTHANRGYLGIALRLLVSYGWMRQDTDGDEARHALTERGRIAIKHAALYADVVSFIPKAIFLDDFLFGSLGEVVLPSLRGLVVRSEERWGLKGQGPSEEALVERQIMRHLDGMLVGPVMVALAREGVLEQMTATPGGLDIKTLRGNRQSLQAAFELLVIQDWLHIEDGLILTCNRFFFQLPRADRDFHQRDCRCHPLPFSILNAFQRHLGKRCVTRVIFKEVNKN